MLLDRYNIDTLHAKITTMLHTNFAVKSQEFIDNDVEIKTDFSS